MRMASGLCFLALQKVQAARWVTTILVWVGVQLDFPHETLHFLVGACHGNSPYLTLPPPHPYLHHRVI